jgi:hypothetical protein
LFVGADESAKVSLYRLAAYVGIGGWFASLIPALLLQRTAAPAAKSAALFTIKHPARIWKLTLPEAFIGLGAGLALPMLNIFFQQRLGSPDVEIGATFAAGQAVLVVGTFLAPLAAARLGKVNAVVVTRLASIPFILFMALAPDVGSVGLAVAVASLAYVSRIVLMNMASPVRSAFSMEILDPAERGTQTGLQQALTAALSGGASYIGAQWMNAGDFCDGGLLRDWDTVVLAILRRARKRTLAGLCPGSSGRLTTFNHYPKGYKEHKGFLRGLCVLRGETSSQIHARHPYPRNLSLRE